MDITTWGNMPNDHCYLLQWPLAIIDSHKDKVIYIRVHSMEDGAWLCLNEALHLFSSLLLTLCVEFV
ncbi:hypothetical protein HanRHA438_Chr08g0361501 [Helianthus annuus]|nr:hypothetical protein HanIR_Chr16g0821281 [Helianthus annuus]KAJ0898851.1 hypothetical protein HanRHA438_Chr08g0361501 [Helianthus annuus]KAJ0902464.1 hypothetical protein HanPSC8_Chr08g0337361 [Helianthus annuus]